MKAVLGGEGRAGMGILVELNSKVKGRGGGVGKGRKRRGARDKSKEKRVCDTSTVRKEVERRKISEPARKSLHM